MLAKSDLRRLLEYTGWANARVLRACEPLTPEAFVRDLATSHGGIRGTLVHVLSAEWIWQERFEGRAPEAMLSEGDFPDLGVVGSRWRQLEADRWRWFESLKEEAFAGIIEYPTTRGEVHASPLWQLVQHVTNHSTYHRGQVTTLLRQSGVEPIATDMHAWDRASL